MKIKKLQLVLRFKFHKLISICVLIIIFSGCGSKSKVKEEITNRYLYKQGVPEKTSSTSFKTIYNSFGKVVEDSNSTSKTKYVYLNDTLLISKTAYKNDGSEIYSKQNIKYDNQNKKQSIRFFIAYVNSDPELEGGIEYYYISNKLVKAKFFGTVDDGDIVNVDPLNSHIITSNMENKIEKNKIDTLTANFYYGKNNRLRMVAFNNDSISNINFRYYYDKDTNLILKEKHSGYMGITKTIQYTYSSNKLSTKIEKDFKGFLDKNAILSTITKQFNEFEEVIDVIKLDSQNEQEYRFKLTYEKPSRLAEVIKFNNIDEPEFIDKYSYKFY